MHIVFFSLINFQLLNHAEDDETIANMLETFEWFFLPVLNVDGYSFTHTVRPYGIMGGRFNLGGGWGWVG